MTRPAIAIGVAGAFYLGALALVGLLAQPTNGDLGVVLGNEVAADGRPSPRLQARLDAALALFRGGQVPRLLVSGGIDPRNRFDEAAVMARYLTENGVPESAILLDSRGYNTFETARHTAALLHGTGRVVVVTQWFHVPRAMLAMRRFGFQEVSGTWPRFAEIYDVYSFLREGIGLPFYAIRPLGRTGPTG